MQLNNCLIYGGKHMVLICHPNNKKVIRTCWMVAARKLFTEQLLKRIGVSLEVHLLPSRP